MFLLDRQLVCCHLAAPSFRPRHAMWRVIAQAFRGDGWVCLLVEALQPRLRRATSPGRALPHLAQGRREMTIQLLSQETPI